MTISIIAAVAKNNVIGKENALPWHLPEDLKRFRKLTIGKTVLMGRKTFESIINKLGKPLPNRKNIVVTRKKDISYPTGVLIYSDLDKAIREHDDEDLFIIGGGEIYRQTVDKAGILYITHVDEVANGDVFFPEIRDHLWKKTDDEKHDGFSFAKYIRK